MKENKYDDAVFFQKYSEMSRSKYGLSGAGEWYALKKMMPDFTGNERVLDLGCGYGWHCAYAADNGAKSVLGIDISVKMLETAKHKNAREKIVYQRAAMEDLHFACSSFDCVISSLAFHYIQDIALLFRNIYSWLVPGGSFVFSCEHPVFTAQGSQDWYYDENGNILHFPVDNYYYEGKRNAVFSGRNGNQVPPNVNYVSQYAAGLRLYRAARN